MFDLTAVNNPIVVVVAFILVLIPAVIIHELGHFIAAKLAGITILEFGVGMPPRALRLGRWRGTDITLNWLPLGGFVRPLGEDVVRQMGEESTQTDREEALSRGIVNPISVNEARPISRILFMAGGAIANFIMAFVIFAIIGLSGLPQVVGARTLIVSLQPDSALAAAGLQAGDVIDAVNGQPFQTTAVLLESLSGDAPVELGVLRTGEPQSLTIAVEGLPAATAQEHPLVRAVAEGSPAAQAGMLPDDIVVSIDGQPIGQYEELQAYTREHLGEEVTLRVWRAGETLDLVLTPRANPPAGQGAMGIEITSGSIASELGAALAEGVRQELVPQSFGTALNYSVERITGVLSQLAQLPGQIVAALSGSGEASENLRITSPLGISQVGGVLLQESIEQRQPSIILEYIGLISLALGLTNLLPIPALDGGRIVFVVIEKLRGRPISPEREGMVHLIGLALLLSLMVVVIINDIANPLTDILVPR